MSQGDYQPTTPLVGTTIEIAFLVFTLGLAVYFGRFGGPFDDWARQGNLDDSYITVLMILAWLSLAFGIAAWKRPLRYALLAGWVSLATLMRIYQEHHPILNLSAALGVLLFIAILNRTGRSRSGFKDSNA